MDAQSMYEMYRVEERLRDAELERRRTVRERAGEPARAVRAAARSARRPRLAHGRDGRPGRPRTA